jgi:putative membrane protein
MKSSIIRVAAILVVASVAAVVAATAFARSNHRTSGLDVQWLKTSAQGDVFEIKGGRLALSKSTNTAVRALAQRLISDHTKSLQDAEKLAKKNGIKLEKTPTPSEQWELSVVSTMTGKAFDTEYSNLEVRDHQQDISETQDEARMGFNRAIVKDARQEIPMLRVHLHLAKVANASANSE